MATQSGRTFTAYLRQAGFRPLRPNRAREILAIILAVGPPVVTACLAANSDRWDLFERSGSATAAVGLFLASRNYVKYSVHELAQMRSRERETDIAMLLEDIFTGKLGLALSAFGTIIWGWGKYLGWWSFSFLIVWALFAARDAYRDLVRPIGAEAPMSSR
jgi:hypothetical protein